MPTGPKGQRRPANVIGNAIKIARTATADIDDTGKDDGQSPSAKVLGGKGGKARAAKMSPERRAEIARKAAMKRRTTKARQLKLSITYCEGYAILMNAFAGWNYLGNGLFKSLA